VCHESGFLGECVGRCHPGFGRRRRAVELQDSLRRLEPAAVSRNKTSLATRLSKSSAAAEACGSPVNDISTSTKVDTRIARSAPSAKTVAEKTQPRRHSARDRRKPLTAIPAQIKTSGITNSKRVRFVGSCVFICRAAARLFGSSMHLSFYLVVAALVVLGAEVAYALYQLVNLTL
jgi:hypothetical protein